MTAISDRRRASRTSVTHEVMQRIRHLISSIAYELQPDAPRKRLLQRCRKQRQQR